mgnify:CR=1 FL=1
MPPSPPISPEKRKERYLEAVRDKMAKLYAYGEAKPPAREQLWHEITGFLKAGELLGNFTTEELQAMIDDEHSWIFKIIILHISDHCLAKIITGHDFIKRMTLIDWLYHFSGAVMIWGFRKSGSGYQTERHCNRYC